MPPTAISFFLAPPMVPLAILLCTVIFIVICRCFTGEPKRKKPRLPPSPRKLPLIGNLHQLGSLPHRSLRALSEKHGPLMLLHVGQVPTLVVSSAEAAREVMKEKDAVFASRSQFKPLHVLGYGSRSINASRYGEHWRKAKKAAVVHLLSPMRVQSYRRLREEEVALMLERIAAAPSPATVDLNKVLNSFVAALLGRIVIGCRSSGDERTKLFQELLADGNDIIGGLRLDEAFPCIAWLWMFPGMDAKLTKLFKRWDAFLNQILEEHECRAQEGDGDSVGDYVDILLSLNKDPSMEFSLCREDVKAMVLEMLGAGTDTSYTVMEWTMAELIRNPGAMRRAQSEVREIARGKPMATEEDVAQMSYLRALIKESLRLHPPAPLLLPRESMGDTQLQGYDIPTKTRVLVNAWAIARDPMYWEAAEEFRPERFLGNNQVDFAGIDFRFIPFGAGRRICPGINFAMCQIELALANLLYRFDWALPGGVKLEDLDMSEFSGISLRRKHGLRLLAIPRNVGG